MFGDRLRGAHRPRRPDGAAASRACFSFYFRDEVLPYYAGDAVAARELAANDFKYWELMRRACERGCRVFDYGRSKHGTGSFDFKKNWGFEPRRCTTSTSLLRGRPHPAEQPAQPEVPGVDRAVAPPADPAWRTGSGRTSCANLG